MTQENSQTSKSNDKPDDPSGTSCGDDSKRKTAVDATLRANSSMTEHAMQEETDQPLGESDESKVVCEQQQHNETLQSVPGTTEEVLTNSRQNESKSSPSSSPTILAMERNTNADHSSNLPAEDLEVTILRRILSQQHAAHAQAQSPPRSNPLSNEPGLDQQRLFLAHPATVVQGIPFAIVPPVPPPPATMRVSLLEQLQLSQRLPNNPPIFPQQSYMALTQALSPHLPQTVSLLGQPQLAALTQNFTGYISQAQAAAQIQLASLLVSAGQSNHGLHMQASPFSLATAHLPNYFAESSNLHIDRQAAYLSPLIQNNEHTNRVEQLVSLLLSQQQITNTLSMPASTPSANQDRLLLRQPNADSQSNQRTINVATPVASTVLPSFLQSISPRSLNNAMISQRTGALEASPSIVQLGSQAAVPASSSLRSVSLNPLQHQLARSSTLLDPRLFTDQESFPESVPPGPSHSKEKRWMTRYKELKQFQEVRESLYEHAC